MRTLVKWTLGMLTALMLSMNVASYAQDGGQPADVPEAEKVARNNDARQKGEPLPYPDVEAEAERQKTEAAARANRGPGRNGAARTGTPAISPGGAAGTPAVPAAGAGTRVALTIGVADEEWGTIVVELHDERVPQTVANFLRYVDSGFYNATIFHRIKPRYLVQAGGFITDFAEKTDGLLPPVQNEAQRAEKNKRGTLAVARSRHDPNSGTSQFFINLADNPRLDFSNDNPGYCVFGRIVEGLEVLDRVATTRVRRSTLVTNEVSQPMTPPQIKSARRLAPGESPTPPKPAATEPNPDPNADPNAAPAQPPTPPPGEPGGNTGQDDGKRDTSGDRPEGSPPAEEPNQRA